MKKKVASITSVRQKAEEKNKEVLDNIADMIHNAKFTEQLKGSTVAEIDQKVQNFLA
jgi:predicted RecB family endonuclease